MKRLDVLYDGECGLCRQVRRWLSVQPAYISLNFLPAQSEEARRRFPSLVRPGRPEELIVVDDAGGVYREARAWLILLYALKDYRAWSFRLARPALFPLARAAVHFMARHRDGISQWIPADDNYLAKTLKKHQPEACELPKNSNRSSPGISSVEKFLAVLLGGAAALGLGYSYFRSLFPNIDPFRGIP